jgi:hypothetical protein
MRKRTRIRLHLDTGRTIDGVLLRKRGRVFELADVRLEINGKLQPVDGTVFVPKDRVEFAQAGALA